LCSNRSIVTVKALLEVSIQIEQSEDEGDFDINRCPKEICRNILYPIALEEGSELFEQMDCVKLLSCEAAN